jgi:hypothetical protein
MFFKKSDKAIIKKIESIEGLGGMNVNERLWASGLMNDFESALLHDEIRARQILTWPKVDELSIKVIIDNRTELIAEIGIDISERLYIVPTKQEFSMIWRSAAEVHWNLDKKCLYSPKPRKWSYYKWYCHIISMVKIDYSCKLYVSENTIWTNIPQSLKCQIEGNDK